MFKSQFMAGFESSSMLIASGRYDAVKFTKHDKYSLQDYNTLGSFNIKSVRDSLRWHDIEKQPGVYDFSSWIEQLEAAKKSETQVIWDLCHFGIPDWLDIWSNNFPFIFGAFCVSAARIYKTIFDEAPIWCCINEISYWSWKGGEVGEFYPFTTGKGPELKKQLISAAKFAQSLLLLEDSRARFITIEPLCRVHGSEQDAWWKGTCEVWDSLYKDDKLDIIGCNYYPWNQWNSNGTISRFDGLYEPLSNLLELVKNQYNRPMFISETGSSLEDEIDWMTYVKSQTELAICWYPIMDYPCWTGNGLIQKHGLIDINRNIRPELKIVLDF